MVQWDLWIVSKSVVGPINNMVGFINNTIMGSTVLFDIIYESHCTILNNFYLYL